MASHRLLLFPMFCCNIAIFALVCFSSFIASEGHLNITPNGMSSDPCSVALTQDLYFNQIDVYENNHKFRLKEYSQKIYVHMNMTEIFLNCSTNKEVAWLRGDVPLVKGGMTLTSDPRIQIIIGAYMKQLHIKEILFNYTGVYHCMEYHLGEIKNTSIVTYDVKVVEELTIDEDVTSVSALEGTNVIMTCSIHGRPEPIIRWYIAGKPLIDTGIKGKILEIVNFTRECGVPYVCVAENGLTNSVNNTITPIPEFPPELQVSVTGANETKNGVQISQKLYKKFNFSCIISANPFSNLTWKRDGNILANLTKPLNSVSQPNISRDGNISHQFEYIYSLKYHENERYTYIATVNGRFLSSRMFGKYSCVVKNKYGIDEKFIEVIQIKSS